MYKRQECPQQTNAQRNPGRGHSRESAAPRRLVRAGVASVQCVITPPWQSSTDKKADVTLETAPSGNTRSENGDSNGVGLPRYADHAVSTRIELLMPGFNVPGTPGKIQQVDHHRNGNCNRRAAAAIELQHEISNEDLQ